MLTRRSSSACARPDQPRPRDRHRRQRARRDAEGRARGRAAPGRRTSRCCATSPCEPAAPAGLLLLAVRGRARDVPGDLHPLQADDRRRPLPHRRVGQPHQSQHGGRQRAARHVGARGRGRRAPRRDPARAGEPARRARRALSEDAAGLQPIEGLVARLDDIASRDGARLQRHGEPTPAQQTALQLIDPDDLPFDPETTAAEDAAGTRDPSDEHSGRRRVPLLAAVVGSVGAAVLAGLLARYIGRARR